MTVEAAKAFIRRMREDRGFHDQIQCAPNRSEREAMIRSAGYDFTGEEFQRAHRNHWKKLFGRVCDTELLGVVGGAAKIAVDRRELPGWLADLFPISSST